MRHLQRCDSVARHHVNPSADSQSALYRCCIYAGNQLYLDLSYFNTMSPSDDAKVRMIDLIPPRQRLTAVGAEDVNSHFRCFLQLN
jgi:hypothetical protein